MEPAQAPEKGGMLEGPEQSDDALSLLAACQMHACFYGYKAREEEPWGRKRPVENNTGQARPSSFDMRLGLRI